MKCDPWALYKIIGAFLLCALIGWFLVKPANNGPNGKVEYTMIIEAYDNNGDPIKADLLSQPGIERQPTGDACQITRPAGTKLDVEIQPKDAPRFGGKRTERLIWRTETEFRTWLDKDLPAILQSKKFNTSAQQKIISRLNIKFRGAKYYYPIIFESRS